MTLPMPLVLAPFALLAASAQSPDLPAGLARAFHAARADERFAIREDAECGVWRAAERPDELGARFDARGLSLSAPAAELRLRLAPELFVRGAERLPIGAVEEHAVSGRRIELRREALVEWYVHDASGLEQGFMIQERPAAGERGPLALVLSLSEGYEAEVLPGARDALLRDARSGATLTYTGLVVWDGAGRPVTARLAEHELGLAIEVEDEGARYPLTIDPLIGVYLAELQASDAAPNDLFGTAVALSGDTVLVGAPNVSAAYVYVRQGSAWVEEARLVRSGRFGSSVALEGDRALVGAPYFGSSFNPGGAAFVFVRSGSAWTEEAQLTTADPHFSEPLFGYAVALSGDRALIGAPHRTPPSWGFAVGAAYVFERSGSQWAEQVRLVAGDEGIQYRFGLAVALDGDDALIGANGALVAGSPLGAAYAFENVGGAWIRRAKLTPSPTPLFPGFGRAVSISGNTALITGGELAGYVFVRAAGVWSQQARLAPGDSDYAAGFGLSAAVSGDLAVVGAPGCDSLASLVSGAGAAYVFTRSGTTWSQAQKLFAAAPSEQGKLGSSLAVEGARIVAGAPSGGFFNGSVHVIEVVDPGATVCDASDGALASCPCGNPGDPDSGCDNAQGTGGVRLVVPQQNPVTRTAFLLGEHFPAVGEPGVVVLRGRGVEPVPVVLGDGLRCVDGEVMRVGVGQATQGTFARTIQHGVADAGNFVYQLWYRNTPASYCTPSGFNTSNGVVLSW